MDIGSKWRIFILQSYNKCFEQGYTYINGEHTYYHATGRKFLIDNQQNIWLSCDSGVDQLTFLNESYSYFSTGHNDKIRGLFVDSKQRIWVADKVKE